MLKSKPQDNFPGVLPGEYYISNQSEVIATVLDSCVSVYIYPNYLKMPFHSTPIFIHSVVVPLYRGQPCASSRFALNKNRRTLNSAFSSSLGIRDTRNGIGGMNHFLLPDKKLDSGSKWSVDPVDQATRYGTHAMEHMVNDIEINYQEVR